MVARSLGRCYARMATKHSGNGPRSSRIPSKVLQRPRQTIGLARPSLKPEEIAANQLKQDPLSPSPNSATTPAWNDYDAAPTPNAKIPNDFDVPVNVPHDPSGILQPNTPAAGLLAESGLVVVRQLEMMNVFLGFEQANRYVITNGQNQTVGYLAEETLGLTNALTRQFLRGRRPFKCTVMDASGRIVLRVHRPFQFINSRITVSLGEDTDNIIGEQEWHPWRRRYNLFKRSGTDFDQFARIDSPLLSWDFYATDNQRKIVASVNRNWSGFGRELFTDTGQYVLRFDAVANQTVPDSAAKDNTGKEINPPSKVKDLAPIHEGITLDQRAVLLATAMSLDVDYFSRHSASGPSMLPFMMPFPFGGGGNTSESPEGNDGLRSDSDNDAQELPRSSNQNEIPTDPNGWNERSLDEGETMQDPFDTGEMDVDDWE